MKERLIPGLAIFALATALAGCNRPDTAYNNSGASAAPGSVNTTVVPATPAAGPASADTAPTSTSSAMSAGYDTPSPPADTALAPPSTPANATK